MTEHPNVLDLARAMRQLKEDYRLGSVRVTVRIPTGGGQLMTVEILDDHTLSIQDEVGNHVLGRVP